MKIYRSAASLFVCIDFLWTFTHFYTACGVWSWLRCSNFTFDFSGHKCERFFYIYGFFCRCFEESDIKMIGKLLCFLVRDLSLVFQILFVSYEDSRDIFLSMFINFAHPLWNLWERLSIGDIISDDNTVSSLIITACDCLESLLTSSIPNLQFNSFSININSSDFEINTDCRHEIIIENIVLKNEKI